MKAIEISEATGALSDYARRAKKETVVVTQRGKPVAAVVAVDPEGWEDWVVSHDPGFLAMMERSEARYRAEGGLTSDQVRGQLGIERRGRKRKAR